MTSQIQPKETVIAIKTTSDGSKEVIKKKEEEK